MPAIVRYAAFRTFDSWRIEANNAIAALVVSAQIAEADLTRRIGLGEGGRFLPVTYPVPEARSLNRSLSDALEVVEGSEFFLAAMAIPFVVAIYGEMLVDAANLLDQDNQWPHAGRPEDLMLGPLRHRLRTAGLTPASDAESLIDFVQRLRNKIIHAGGRVDQGLIDGWMAVTPAARSRWTRMAGSPQLTIGERAPLSIRDIKATLGAVNHSVVEVNGALRRTLSRRSWARVAVDDWRSNRSAANSLNDLATLRKLSGYSRMYYGALGLSEGELATEVRADPF